jgi:predicted alpha/beta superfamily hydrolase
MKKYILPLLFIVSVLSCKPTEKKTLDDTDSTNEVEESVIEFETNHGLEVASGTLHRIKSFPSMFIKPRPVDIWLPDGYSQEKKYAVLYMHDGQMLFDAKTTWNKQEWKADDWAGQLQKEGKTKVFIIVAPHNIAEIRHSDYFPQKPFESLTKQQQDSIFEEAKKVNHSFKDLNSDNYLKFLTTELKRYIDIHYSVHRDKENTFVLGSSMGGLISMYAVSEYPEVFGGAGCLSTHWIGTYTNKNNPIPETFFKYMEANLPEAKTHKIYFDYGTETLDALYLPYQETVTELIKKKGHTENRKFAGTDHSENSWNQRLDIPFTFLLGK